MVGGKRGDDHARSLATGEFGGDRDSGGGIPPHRFNDNFSLRADRRQLFGDKEPVIMIC